jgi:hypothetical protein
VAPRFDSRNSETGDEQRSDEYGRHHGAPGSLQAHSSHDLVGRSATRELILLYIGTAREQATAPLRGASPPGRRGANREV